ncbi:uroporphyrinogen-III synthase [Rhodovulum imhoffii]|uniref:Uroporphyrinogen-III synthase n=1 Tax=Rhodovulum imhoffii TaxID=365340 RepID=A0A2T5BP51_9RHOB|nr:uroporphyrinogen-III synthase [Rhodovulum imhoffii]MBK5933169.1 hypothetical protein [Rhodovulum imhoffii]PTN00794.1 uroporphyrinogen-III synthase [Rhodovulum imhoffii]
MSSPRITLILTRPKAQSARFASQFAMRFGDAIPAAIFPVMEIVPTDAPISVDGIAGLIFSSENGVAAFTRSCGARDLPAWCVGARTAAAARRAGMETRTGQGNAEDLIARITANPPEGRLLHVHGVHSRGAIAPRLTAAGIPTGEVVVYDQIARPLPPEGRATLEAAEIALLPLFSPRSAALVSKGLAGSDAHPWVATMSAAVTDRWAGPVPARLEQAKNPSAASMMDALANLIDAARAG